MGYSHTNKFGQLQVRLQRDGISRLLETRLQLLLSFSCAVEARAENFASLGRRYTGRGQNVMKVLLHSDSSEKHHSGLWEFLKWKPTQPALECSCIRKITDFSLMASANRCVCKNMVILSDKGFCLMSCLRKSSLSETIQEERHLTEQYDTCIHPLQTLTIYIFFLNKNLNSCHRV